MLIDAVEADVQSERPSKLLLFKKKFWQSSSTVRKFYQMRQNTEVCTMFYRFIQIFVIVFIALAATTSTDDSSCESMSGRGRKRTKSLTRRKVKKNTKHKKEVKHTCCNRKINCIPIYYSYSFKVQTDFIEHKK